VNFAANEMILEKALVIFVENEKLRYDLMKRLLMNNLNAFHFEEIAAIELHFDYFVQISTSSKIISTVLALLLPKERMDFIKYIQPCIPEFIFEDYFRQSTNEIALDMS
jgi:hypothetical protein